MNILFKTKIFEHRKKSVNKPILAYLLTFTLAPPTGLEPVTS